MWIQYSDYFVPDGSVSVEDLFKELTAEELAPFFKDKEEAIQFFKKEVGYKDIFLTNEKETELTMVCSLIDKVFLNRICRPNDIDALLLLQENPTYSLGKEIQYQYGLRGPLILNLSGNECANFEYALYVADIILATDPDINNILIAGSVKHPTYSHRVTNKFSLNGDASGIMLVSRAEKKWKYNSSLITNFSVNPSKPLDITKSVIHFEQLLQRLPPDILEQPYTLILQNANVSVLEYILEKCRFNIKNVFQTPRQYNHLYTLDLLVNATDFMNSGDEETEKLFLVGSSSTGILSFTTLEKQTA